MKNNYLIIDTRADGYNVSQLEKTITVGEMKKLLEEIDDDTLIVLENDNGYTYGSIFEENMREAEYDDESNEWYMY